MYCCNELVIYWQLASFLTLAVVSGESVDALAAVLACRRRRADAAVQTRLAAAVRVCVRQHPHLSLSTPAGRARYGVHLRLSVCLSVRDITQNGLSRQRQSRQWFFLLISLVVRLFPLSHAHL